MYSEIKSVLGYDFDFSKLRLLFRARRGKGIMKIYPKMLAAGTDLFHHNYRYEEKLWGVKRHLRRQAFFLRTVCVTQA